MHQDIEKRIDAAAIEELKNPGTEPEWATSLAAARQRIGEMQQGAGVQDGMILIQHQVIADLRNEIARLLSERETLQARASRTLWQHCKDVFCGQN